MNITQYSQDIFQLRQELSKKEISKTEWVVAQAALMIQNPEIFEEYKKQEGTDFETTTKNSSNKKFLEDMFVELSKLELPSYSLKFLETLKTYD